jgi:hypothetical protein
VAISGIFSLQRECEICACAPLRSRYALRGNVCHRHVVSSTAVIEFLVKEGNSAGGIYERLRGVYGDVCMGVSSVRRWVKHFKDGNCGHYRSAALWSTWNCCN